MRLLVLSDSHRAKGKLLQIAQLHYDDADLFVFLGDGEDDFDALLDRYPHLKYERVSGNCDWGSLIPTVKILDDVGGKRAVITHGHPFHVKHGYQDLERYAKSVNAALVLFGHTHQQYAYYDAEHGISYMNPGSVANGEYGMVDIVPTGVVLNPCRL